jgi:hypothetical protein
MTGSVQKMRLLRRRQKNRAFSAERKKGLPGALTPRLVQPHNAGFVCFQTRLPGMDFHLYREKSSSSQ